MTRRDDAAQHADDLATALYALREIAKSPLVERNPDGVDQAAWSMQLLAEAALKEIDA